MFSWKFANSFRLQYIKQQSPKRTFKMGKTVSELIKRKHKCLGVSHHFYLFLKIHKISSCVAGSKNVLKQKCWPIFKGYQKIFWGPVPSRVGSSLIGILSESLFLWAKEQKSNLLMNKSKLPGAQMGLNHENKRGQKSGDILPLRNVNTVVY